MSKPSASDEGQQTSAAASQPLPDSQRDVAAKRAIDFISKAVEKGLTRVLAVEVVNNPTLFAEIDRVLEQAVAISRQGLIAHAVGARLDTHVIFVLDQDPQLDWLLPAVRKRLADAAFSLNLEIDTSDALQGDLSGGQTLRFMGFELRTVHDRHGMRLKYKRIDESGSPQEETPQPALQDRPKRLKSKRMNESDSSEDDTPQPTPPARPTRWPQFRWPFSGLGLARWAWAAVRSVSAIAHCARKHWLKAAVIASAEACVVLLFFLFVPRSMREVPAPHMPLGFYRGEYRATATAQPVRYGLYVPPYFSKARGPFPLVVFFHGYPERGIDRCFAVGLAQSIVLKFGEHTPNGRFEFAAFFPIDPEGMWSLKPKEIDGIVGALDDVVRRYNIDPKRLYLTGHSNGADGVWALAHAHPEKWAALATASSFGEPEIDKVRRVPIWIFHGAKDPLSPVERTRAIVQKLKDANADVRYTEIPDRAHVIWREVYDHKPLYDWFATKTRP